MFTPVLVVPDVGTISLYLWVMSSSIQGISAFIGASILVLIFIIGSVHAWRKGTLECFSVFEYSGGEGEEGSTK
jgi:NADH:ubiquinone oxidoreductase subunit 3 (subunit A)